MWKQMIAAAALLLTSVTVSASSFVAGQHYDVVAEKPTQQAEVREFFSFYCPHCYHFEPVLKNVVQQLPKDTAVVKNHVDFLGFAPTEVQTAITRGFVAAVALGKGPEAADVLFKSIHEKGARPANEADVRTILLSIGLDAAKYDETLHSSSVNSTVGDMQFQQGYWSKAVVSTPTPMLSMMLNNDQPKPVLSGVPALIINGKYKVNLAALDANNIEQQLAELVKFLLTNP